MGQQGSTMVILLAKRHRMNRHNSWCVSSDSHKFRKKKLNSYLLNDFCLRDNQDCINASRKCFKVILNFWKVKRVLQDKQTHTHQHEHVPTFKRERQKLGERLSCQKEEHLCKTIQQFSKKKKKKERDHLLQSSSPAPCGSKL